MEFFLFMYNIINIEVYVILINCKCVYEEMNKFECNSYFKNDFWFEFIFGEDVCVENLFWFCFIKIFLFVSLICEIS